MDKESYYYRGIFDMILLSENQLRTTFYFHLSFDERHVETYGQIINISLEEMRTLVLNEKIILKFIRVHFSLEGYLM